MHNDRRIIALTKFFNIFREVSMWLLFGEVFVIIINIIMRRFFNDPIFGIIEWVKYIMLFCASFSLVENEWVDGNISMKLILDHVSERTRSLLYAIINILIAVMMGFITYLLFMQTFARFSDFAVTPELKMPLWIPEMLLVIGAAILTVGIVSKAVLWGWMWKNNKYIEFVDVGLLRDEVREARGLKGGK
jgi:TRAP-type C4-dicarboxylate transport system permease small subunit